LPHLNYSFLCDYADNSGSKLTAVGIGFDTIYARAVPALHPVLYAVISIQFSSVEVGKKRLALSMVNADGIPLGPSLDQELAVNPPQSGFTLRTVRVVMGIHSIRFESYGDYAAVWVLDGSEVARLPIRIVEPPSSDKPD